MLGQEVLAALPQPYSKDVIDEVFYAIESEPRWRRDYDALCTTFGKTVVNNWLGRWIGISLGKVGEQQVPSRKSRFIASYSLLETDARPIQRKPNEGQALKMMADYFFDHRSGLPPTFASTESSSLNSSWRACRPRKPSQWLSTVMSRLHRISARGDRKGKPPAPKALIAKFVGGSR